MVRPARRDRSVVESTMQSLLKSFWGSDAGATAIEYALIASRIAIALVAILTGLGSQLSAEFSEVSGALK
jgi:pilus assembly protein Flp/PilA